MRLHTLIPSSLFALAGSALAITGVSAQTVPIPVGATPIPYHQEPTRSPVPAFGEPTDAATDVPYHASPRGIFKLFFGIVGSDGGYKLRFVDGRTVYLDRQTVIEPTGETIRRGMQIAVHGYFRPGGITARYIVIENGDGHPH